jgi:hypothetical protein
MANPIENWLYKGATQPRSHYANMPLWKAMAAEIPFSKSYEGFNPKYAGSGKVGLPRYMYEGARSLLGGQHGNIAGGTTGMRALYERLAPWLGRAARGVGWAGSAPATGILTALTPSAGAGQQELQWEEENQRRMAAEVAAAKAAAAKAAAIKGGAAGASTPTYQDTAQDRQEQRERERGGANRSFTRTKYGKAYKKGGIVGLNYLTRRV